MTGGRWALGAVVVAVAVAGACTLGGPAVPGRTAGAINIDRVPLIEESQRQPAPPLDGPTTAGERFDAAVLDGRPAVVNFWASWCGPCASEIPELAAVDEAYGDEVVVLGVNVRDSEVNARAFERDLDVPYPSLFDPAVEVAAAFGGIAPEALPSTVLLDARGRVAGRLFGAVTRETLEPYLERLLDEG